MKKIFTGELSQIKPSRLISTSKNDDLENFFLVLSLIFNDIKGLVVIHRTFYSTYKNPDKNLTFHSGEFMGIDYQLRKLMISTLAEMLVFLDKNRTIIHSPRFQLLLKKTDIRTKKFWQELLSNSESIATRGSLSKILVIIRSNIGFHFNHGLSEIKKSFVDFFSKEGPEYEFAYYSFGESMEKTRFFYADAAIQQYIDSKVSKEDLKNLFQIIEQANIAISSLIYQFLKDKGIER